jgi:uncharacterized sulfatase
MADIMRKRHHEIASLPLRVLLSAIGCALLPISAALTHAEDAKQADIQNRTRPNIVFILTDDLAPTAVGFAGNPQLRTPHIDRIAREGAILTQAFVTTPVCSPSRAGLVSSRYSSELGIPDWINPREEQELGLDVNLTTWMQLLQQDGYHTGLFGKWHLGTADRYHPTRRGYDEFVGFRDGGRPPRDAVLEIDGKDVKTEGFIVDVVTDHALTFLERNSQRPFLLSLHYREPHSAWLPTREEDWAPFKDLDVELPEPDFPKLNVRKVKRMTREYYASITSVDRNLGRVLEAIDRLGIGDNTIVIFTSDHGYNTGHHGLWFKGNAHWELTELPPQRWPKIARERRPNLYDQALRVPAAVRWPAKIRAGMTVPQMITNLDWYPTLLAMAKVDLPADVTIRGRNAWPMFQGQRIAWDNDLYTEYSMRHGSTTDMRGYRTPDWKLMIDFANEGRAELYDLKNDPAEHHNLIESSDPAAQAARQELEARILTRMKELNDPALSLANEGPST